MFGLALRDSGLEVSDLCALARAAEDAGFTSLWTPELASRDAFVLAGLYGSHTRKITVGTGVIPLFSRNAVALAIGAATAAEASGGRFVLGLGTGHRAPSEAWYGAQWNHVRVRLRETMEVVREILAGRRVTRTGEVRVDGFHLVTNPPPVPIFLGALTPTSLRLAGELADGVILNWLPPEGLERAALVAREAAADANRRIKILTYVRAAVVEDPDAEHAARTQIREQAYAYLHLPAYANALRHTPLAKHVNALMDGDERALGTLSDALCLCGDAQQVRSGLDAFRQAGVDGLIVYPVPFGETPAESVLHTLRALAPNGS